MNVLVASLILLVPVNDPPLEDPISEFNPEPAWTYSIAPTLVNATSNSLFQVAGTITDSDTYLKSGFPATYINVPNSDTGWTLTLDSGSLLQINDANGNPVPNPTLTPLGAGSEKSTYTIRAKGVSVVSVYVDTYVARDFGGVLRPPSPQHIWDGNGSIQTCYVTVRPSQ